MSPPPNASGRRWPTHRHTGDPSPAVSLPPNASGRRWSPAPATLPATAPPPGARPAATPATRARRRDQADQHGPLCGTTTTARPPPHALAGPAEPGRRETRVPPTPATRRSPTEVDPQPKSPRVSRETESGTRPPPQPEQQRVRAALRGGAVAPTGRGGVKAKRGAAAAKNNSHQCRRHGEPSAAPCGRGRATPATQRDRREEKPGHRRIKTATDAHVHIGPRSAPADLGSTP